MNEGESALINFSTFQLFTIINMIFKFLEIFQDMRSIDWTNEFFNV